MNISYCYGRSKIDVHPVMFQAPNFDSFVNQLLAFPRARTKGYGYICSPLRRNGTDALHRRKIDVLPRWWLGVDLDGASREEADLLLMRLLAYLAIAWETASSTPEHPRWRIIVFLDREVDHAEGVRLGAALIGVLGAGLSSLKWDKSTHHGEQMCYLPLAGAEIVQYRGDAVDVNAMLALAPAEETRERPATSDPYEALIIERGKFLYEIDASKAAITCPFEEDHSEKTSDSSTVYFRPLHGGYRWGRIHCSHTTHCTDRQQEEFIEKLGGNPREVWREQAREDGTGGASPDPTNNRFGDGATPPPSAIAVLAGNLPHTLDEAESALLTRGGVYQRGSLLVRVVTIPETRVTQGVRRHKGAMVILPFDKAYLVESLTSSARWEMFNPKTKKFYTINCPKNIAEGLIARVGNWRFPVLAGISESPYMIDGQIYAGSGYEPITGVYLNLGHNKFPEIQKNPTKQDAEKALQKLKDVVKDFPFVEEVDCAVWICALLTTFVRLGLRTSPLFGFSATVMGSGKSLLEDLISIIATGRRATVMTAPLDKKEEKKTLLSVLIEGDPIIVIDNIGETWSSDTMSAILTAETYKDRLLGVNKSVSVPTTATWIATGNNLSFAGDLSSRVLVARLDARCERPDERSFDRDLLTWVPEHRPELVAAALTILAGHAAAGYPTGALRPFGRFEDWSRIARAAVVWLGMPDPCRARTHVEDDDPVKQSLGAVLVAWRDCFEDTPKTVGQADKNGSDELRAALLIVSGDNKGAINLRRAGIWFAKYGGRVVDGLRFERAGLFQRSILWTSTRVESSESVSSSESCYDCQKSGTRKEDNLDSTDKTHKDSQTHKEAGCGEGEGARESDGSDGSAATPHTWGTVI